MNNPPRRRWKRRLSWLAAALSLSFLVFLVADWLFPLPLASARGARIVLAEDGTPLWRFADENGVWRYPVEIEEVSPLYIEALLDYEDRWFHHHPGVNPLALARAAWQNLSSQRIVSGGSTISMQVARLIEPHSRTIPGKLRQIWRTFQLEWHLSKREILTLYLNRAPYGGTLEGVAAASWAYLDKSPAQLTPAEAALLVVLPQSPTRLRPDRNPQAAQDARDKVLRRLAAHGIWPAARIADAIEEPVRLAPRREPRLAPLLARRVSAASDQASIRTTIDAQLQHRLEDALAAWKTRLPERSSAAILVIEHRDMAVRAYLGSVDFDDDKRFGHVDMVRAVRSPGSTLKPFLYGMAIDQGLIHSESLLMDVPRRHGDYRPDNFSTGFSGPVSASNALYRSLNLPAVQLLESYGPKRFTGVLRGAGLNLTLPESAEPNLAVILGGTGAHLEQLTAAYSVFARGGLLAQPRLLPQTPLTERRLLSPGAAWIVRRILSGQLQPGPEENPLFVQRAPLSWKTGTSYGFRDAWAIGVGPRYLIGIWIGRPDGTPVAGQFGAASATPLLLLVHDLLTNRDLQRGIVHTANPPPKSVGETSICWPGGQALPPGDPNCRRARQAWTLDGLTPPTLHAANQPLSDGSTLSLWLDGEGKQVAPDCPGAKQTRVILWPAALEPWLPAREQRAARLPPVAERCPPRAPVRGSPLVIAGVRDGESLRLPGGARKNDLRLKVSALGGAHQRWWFLNGTPLQRTQGHEELAFTLREHGQYQLSVLDESGQSASVHFQVFD
ncbi:MAG: peptidoglycan glycosyltransferase PbpC [Azoarcus sp.]|jgi:penicillin-binding protein 1C|nr:peptidoglycan glycosyltransferase PbpC [Azoarcus sp.]